MLITRIEDEKLEAVTGGGVVSVALSKQADIPPGGSAGNFNMAVAGPKWLGKAGGVFEC